MQFLRNTWVVFRYQASAIVFSKRMLLCSLLAAVPPVLGYIVARQEQAFGTIAFISLLFSLQVMAPFMGLLMGSAVVAEEVENRTITYMFSRPIQRMAFFAGRMLGTLLPTLFLLAGSSILLFYVVRTYGSEPATIPATMLGRLLLATALGGSLYAMISAGLGVFFKRAMIMALGYAVAIEGFLANIPGSSQKLSIQYYLRSILTGLGEPQESRAGSPWLDLEVLGALDALPVADSVMRLVLLFVVLGLGCALGIRHRQFVLSS